MDGFDCCDKTNCIGTCDWCGFSKCPEALDVDRCDCKEETHVGTDIEVYTGDTAHEVEDYSGGESRGHAMLSAYQDAFLPDEPLETVATDMIADILRAVPEEDWYTVIRSGLMHAHEEIHGWGSARAECVLTS
ncbi:hypothetical protein [Acrocarpospora sp. B8E8]|uniref:hypothetical protein n=1 Tax=Acrocarpospora sp. B8E8 TaxID=3153572 RepID=UPI00325DECAF